MTTRRVLILSVAYTALATLAGCATSTAPRNVAEVIASDPQLSEASKLLLDSGVAETLRGPGPFTVFVPSDEAFKSVSAATRKRLGDVEGAKNVARYHVVQGTLLAADASNRSFKSMQGASLAVSRAGDFITIEEAVITRTDIIATNGVVHVIDRVLAPPSKH